MFEAVMETAGIHGWLPMITAYRYAPGPMEGAKTVAHEIVEALRGAPDRVYVPVGGGGLLAATWRGFVEASTLGWARRTPGMVAVQPEGCAPVARAVLGLPPADTPVTTAVSGLQVSDPPDADLAQDAIAASKGSAVLVSDDAIRAARRALARDEGIFAEPAGAASLAGLLVDLRAGAVSPGAHVVCLITGTGFKDASGLSATGAAPVLAVDELDRLGSLAASLVEQRASRSRT
jgi:threonine synthase